MKTKLREGALIVLEGLDGVGKTSTIEWLRHQLPIDYFEITVVREPGTDQVSEDIRDVIMSSIDIDDMAELLLFQAARAQVMYKKVLPALERGELVLMDRYAPSTLAYQGFGKERPHDDIYWLNSMATHRRLADLVVLLDGDPRHLTARLKRSSEPNKYDRMGYEFYNRVRHGYQNMAARSYFAKQWVTIDALRPEAAVQADVLAAIVGHLSQGGLI